MSRRDAAAGVAPAPLAGLFVLAFALLSTYAIARPATESLFLERYGAESLPYVWIAVAITAAVVVVVYNRFSAGRDLARVFGVMCAISAALLVLLILAYDAGVPGATFALYVWKDIYIVVLVEVFWSIANNTFEVTSAKKLYGLFCAVGALGGIAGNLSVGPLASQVGTASTLWVVPVVLGLVGFGGSRLAATLSAKRPVVAAKPSFGEGFAVVMKSRYLGLMALLIIVVQISINLVDYEYNRFLAYSYPDTDARTQIIGRIYAAIDFGSISLQVLTGAILKYAGVGGTLIAIPMLLAAAVSAFVAVPRFLSIAAGKVLSKALDYSLFRAAKEILYIPLDYDAKTRGKAVVDMLVYRFAKGLASAVILAVTAWWGKDASLGVLTLGFIVVWLVITVTIVRRYRSIDERQTASPGPGTP